MKWSPVKRVVLVTVGILPSLGLACVGGPKGATTGGTGGTGTTSSSTTTGGPGGGAAGGLGLGGGPVNTGPAVSLTVTPSTASLDVVSGSTAGQVFQATVKYQDGTSGPADSVAWSATNPAVGSIDGTGTFTAGGVQGGARDGHGQLRRPSPPPPRSPSRDLRAEPRQRRPAARRRRSSRPRRPTPRRSGPTPTTQMTYPRGIGAPPLMWNGGAATRPALRPPLERDLRAPELPTDVAGRFDFDPTVWSDVRRVDERRRRAHGGAPVGRRGRPCSSTSTGPSPPPRCAAPSTTGPSTPAASCASSPAPRPRRLPRPPA